MCLFSLINKVPESSRIWGKKVRVLRSIINARRYLIRVEVMPSHDDWFRGDHYVDATIDYFPEELPELWRLRPWLGRGKGMPELTPEEEYDEMNKQVKSSKGFDIDFTKFSCLFNYRPVELDRLDYAEEPPTAYRVILTRLSKKSLEDYNEKEGTSFEYVKVVKSNYFPSAGMVYFITFEVIDPFDGELKLFRSKIRYFYCFETEYFFCRPKPGQKAFGTVKAYTSRSLLKTQAEYRTEEDGDELLNSGPQTEALRTSRKARQRSQRKTGDGQAQRNPVKATPDRPKIVFLQNQFHALGDITTDHP